MPPFINGLIFGLIFLLALGPAFFALIQTSIQQGFKKAVFLAIGVSLSDTFYVLIVLLGFAKVFDGDDIRFWLALFGSAMLFGYAIFSWFKKPQIFSDDSEGENTSAKNFLKGLLLNGLNPFIVVSWVTWVSAMTVKFAFDFNAQVQFFAGMLITIFCMDIGKAFLAHRLNHLITIKFVRRMNRSIAVILLLFGIQIVYYLFQNHV